MTMRAYNRAFTVERPTTWQHKETPHKASQEQRISNSLAFLYRCHYLEESITILSASRYHRGYDSYYFGLALVAGPTTSLARCVLSCYPD